MSVKVTGQKKLMADIEKHLGKATMQKVTDAALIAGAKVFVKELRIQVKTFSDKTGYSEGHTYDEITITKPYTKSGVRMVSVHWRGPKDRYRIIHLNEWGTVQNPNPRGKGKIAAALRNAEKAYRSTIIQHLRRGI